ncbi:MAG TPA: hypothetical protein VLN47_06610 [Clostridiaceae bacterium]|nr:hypothetical protein [Clostridiaceae bacterium]
MLKLDLKRALFNRNTLTALLIGFAIAAFGIWESPIRMAMQLANSTAADLTEENRMYLIGGMLNEVYLFDSSQWLYAFVIPFVGILPHAASYFTDRKSNFSRQLIIRSNFKRYVKMKLVNVFLSGFLVSLAVSALTILFIYSINMENGARGIYYSTNFLNDISRNNFFAYVMIHAMLTAVLTGLVGLMGLAVSALVNHKVLIYIIPFLMVTLSRLFFTGTLLDLRMAHGYFTYWDITFNWVVFQLTLIAIVTVSVFLFTTWKKKEHI